MALRALAVVFVSVVCACGDDEGFDLVVDVQTDLVPGREFSTIDLTVRSVRGTETESCAALRGEPWYRGRRLTQIEQLPAGSTTVSSSAPRRSSRSPSAHWSSPSRRTRA